MMIAGDMSAKFTVQTTAPQSISVEDTALPRHAIRYASQHLKII